LYIVRFKNHGGHVFSTKFFKADDDASASAKAQVMYVPAFGPGYDLWQGERLVSSYPKARTEPAT
jgi:hypothetical protein